MAKNTLPVNFQDDILNSAMGGKRRYKVINNSDGTISLEDATTYDQVGSNFGAGQMNATNVAVNASADAGKIIDDIDAIRNVTKDGYMAGALALKQIDNSLGGLRFGYDGDSNKYGYYGADGSLIPFSRGVTILGLIVHTDSRSGYVPNTEVSDYYTTGKLTIVDNGDFTYEESNKFVCQKSGTLRVVGAIGIAGGSTYNIIVSKNGVGQTNKATSAKVHFEFDVAEGDVIQVQYDGGAGWWWNTWLTMIL